MNFINAVIEEASFDNCLYYIKFAEKSEDAEIIIGGRGNKSEGYFVEPTIIVTTNPKFKSKEWELFWPILTIFFYKDRKLEKPFFIGCRKFLHQR